MALLSLEADYKRFCGLHSWYKHIPLTGKDFYVYQAQGEQARNGVCPQVSDPIGMHWHFSTWPLDPTDPTASYKVRFGPFLRGIEGWMDNNTPIVNGFHIIVSDAGTVFMEWIEKNYPHLAHLDWCSPMLRYTAHAAIKEIYQTECARYWRDLTTVLSDLK